MKAEVIILPALLKSGGMEGRAVVVFDVLRATTTMTAALAAGVKEIRIFGSLDEARLAKSEMPEGLLCGEVNCLPPDDFDLGNSPGGFTDEHAQRIVLMSTTNGTRAILAARQAQRIFIGSLANASAVARQLEQTGLEVTLLCAGTNGQISLEDLLGAGAVLNALLSSANVELQNDAAKIALTLFQASAADLQTPLFDSAGGRNIVTAGLSADVIHAAQLDRFDLVGQVLPDPLRVVRCRN